MTLSRRDFFRRTGAGACALALSGVSTVGAADRGAEQGVPRRQLGRTGVDVSILGLGGYHLGSIDDDKKAVELVHECLDQGVTFFDSAWEYHHGRSEKLLGRALQGRRDKAFVMTKHHGRDYKTAMEQLEESLERLQTDVIDLWQFHEVVYDDDPEKIFSDNGGIKAAVEAKKQGKVRFIGFTGHKDPKLFLQMLDHDYKWDTVQMPVNLLDPHFRSFQKQVMPILQRRNIGLIAMKTMAGGHLLRTGTVTPKQALYYAWSQPVSTIVSGITSKAVLRENVRHAREFSSLDEKQQQELVAETAAAGEDGRFEPFKTSRQYDGWAGRKQHGIPVE